MGAGNRNSHIAGVLYHTQHIAPTTQHLVFAPIITIQSSFPASKYFIVQHFGKGDCSNYGAKFYFCTFSGELPTISSRLQQR